MCCRILCSCSILLGILAPVLRLQAAASWRWASAPAYLPFEFLPLGTGGKFGKLLMGSLAVCLPAFSVCPQYVHMACWGLVLIRWDWQHLIAECCLQEAEAVACGDACISWRLCAGWTCLPVCVAAIRQSLASCMGAGCNGPA